MASAQLGSESHDFHVLRPLRSEGPPRVLRLRQGRRLDLVVGAQGRLEVVLWARSQSVVSFGVAKIIIQNPQIGCRKNMRNHRT